jgi:hypothetical protein
LIAPGGSELALFQLWEISYWPRHPSLLGVNLKHLSLSSFTLKSRNPAQNAASDTRTTPNRQTLPSNPGRAQFELCISRRFPANFSTAANWYSGGPHPPSFGECGEHATRSRSAQLSPQTEKATPEGAAFSSIAELFTAPSP